jgi:hypothetical protein
MLLPLSKSSFLHLDLLRKPLSQQLFLFLELGVVELLDLGLAKLARLHLGLTVQLVVRLFGGGDQVEHMHAEEQRTEFSEIAVILVVDYTVQKKMSVGYPWGSLSAPPARLHTFGHSPKIFSTLDDPSISGLDILRTSDD